MSSVAARHEVVVRTWIALAVVPIAACDRSELSPSGQVAVGSFFACAVFEGELSCRSAPPNEGSSDMFDGMTDPAAQILDRIPEGRFVSVGAGFGHACALGEDGIVRCWSVDGTYVAHLVAPTEPLSHLTVGGYYGACALDADGAPACWGDGTVNAPTTEGFKGMTGLLDITNNVSGFVCVLDREGVALCGGEEPALPGAYDDLEASGPVCGLTATGLADCGYYPTTGRWTQISLGLSDLCGLREGGLVGCEPLGESYPTPLVPPRGKWIAVGASSTLRVACALDAAGELTCFGDDAGLGFVDE